MGPGLGGPGEAILAIDEMALFLLQWGRALEGPERGMRECSFVEVFFASMGPGLGGPGERVCNGYRGAGSGGFNGAGPWRARREGEGAHPWRPPELQWGRALEGPERRRSGKSGPAPGTLQWGRALEGPERQMTTNKQLSLRAASMGPGLGGPGEVSSKSLWWMRPLASMGPGLGGPGEAHSTP